MKKPKPFKKKNRVKVYATLCGQVAESPGTITGIREDGMLFVDVETVEIRNIVAHPKQCRRLRKK